MNASRVLMAGGGREDTEKVAGEKNRGMVNSPLRVFFNFRVMGKEKIRKIHFHSAWWLKGYTE